MTARFPNMIGIIRTCIKTGLTSCEIPANKLCISVLRILRDQGYIFGFNFVSPKKKSARLFPRVQIHFKFTDIATSILKDIGVFKTTHSNYHTIRSNSQFQILSEAKFYLISSTKGLSLTSFSDVYRNQSGKIKNRIHGKILLELQI